MKALNSKAVKHFLNQVLSQTEGQWILIGGTVLMSYERDLRTTTDIDLISLDASEQSSTLKLMEISEELGYPIETINSAGEYFLKKIRGFEKNLILLMKNSNCRIYVPNTFLFLSLKIPRLTPADLDDCLEYLSFQTPLTEEQKSELAQKIKVELTKEDSRLPRLMRLMEALNGP